MSQIGLDVHERTTPRRRWRPVGLGRDAITELYAAHRLSLVRLAILLVDDQASAEDVVQDAFAALLARADGIQEPAAALGYLRTSVVNGSRSALRRR
ncbi:MAG: hypothetical protein F2667_14500, partial [Actinobacteria bacterium]|nr:hypothetical protein [Actinomycetota bacterium]